MAIAEDGRFGLGDLLAWAAQGDAARRDETATAGEPFSTVTMSDLPDASPPFRPGALFVAIRGERRDGHDFAKRAFERGARAALVARVPENLREEVAAGRIVLIRANPGGASRPTFVPHQPVLLVVDDPQTALQRCAAWWRRQMPARVIAITGSVGKTTTKDLAANVLDRRYRVLRTEGNLNNELGLPFMLLKLTTAHARAVLEIGISDVGEMETFATIAGPDVAVVTRVAPAHLHHFKDVDTVEREKGRLVEALGQRDGERQPAPSGAQGAHGGSTTADEGRKTKGEERRTAGGRRGVAILNADDPRVARMAGRAPGRVVFYGESEAADVRAGDVVARGTEGLDLTIHYQGQSERVQVPLVGRHFVSSVLAAAACALVEGCTWEDVRTGLAADLDGQRLKPRRLPGGVTILDDTYNASPEASRAALDALAALPGRKVAVLGDMFELGDYAEQGHADVGQYVPGRADLLVTVGELGAIIAGAATQAGMPPGSVYTFDGNDEAAAFLGARLLPGDFVLIKGSHGMHMDAIMRALAGE